MPSSASSLAASFSSVNDGCKLPLLFSWYRRVLPFAWVAPPLLTWSGAGTGKLSVFPRFQYNYSHPCNQINPHFRPMIHLNLRPHHYYGHRHYPFTGQGDPPCKTLLYESPITIDLSISMFLNPSEQSHNARTVTK